MEERRTFTDPIRNTRICFCNWGLSLGRRPKISVGKYCLLTIAFLRSNEKSASPYFHSIRSSYSFSRRTFKDYNLFMEYSDKYIKVITTTLLDNIFQPNRVDERREIFQTISKFRQICWFAIFHALIQLLPFCLMISEFSTSSRTIQVLSMTDCMTSLNTESP